MSKRIPNLDALRGLLAICVVIYHIPRISNTVGLPYFAEWAILNRGHEAVLVFFSLSGYLIIGLLYQEKHTRGAISIKDFYVRRALRLYPVYYLVLFFGLFFYHYLLPVLGQPFEVDYSIMEGIAWNVGFLPNVFNTLYKPGAILTVLWSIGIEEQFYLFIAPLLSYLSINKYFKCLLILTISYFIIFSIGVFPVLRKFDFLYFFMSGAGIIAVLEKRGFKLHFKYFALRCSVYLLFFVYFTTDLLRFDERIIANIFELVLFNMLIINISNESKISISYKMLDFLGKISFGIYMYHMIVVTFVLFIFMEISKFISMNEIIVILLINILSILGTVLISHLSFKYFESYFLNQKKKFRN